MRQGGNPFRQHPAIILYVTSAHFQQIVETLRNHVALFHLCNRQGRLVERLQRRLTRV